MSEPQLSLTIQGNDLEPASLRAREVATLITAFEDIIAAVVLRRSPEIKRDMVRVSLVGVQDGSTVLAFAPNLPLLTLPAIREVADAIRRNEFFDLPAAAVEGLREIVGFIKARNASAQLRFGEAGQAVEAQITAHADVFVTTAPQAIASLREEFGQYFDQIDDVDAWVSAVRRGDI